jgi:hypothetical protein
MEPPISIHLARPAGVRLTRFGGHLILAEGLEEGVPGGVIHEYYRAA